MADGMQAVTMPFTTLWGYDTDADWVGIYVFYVVFFTNNLVVTKKQRIFAAEVLQSVIWEQIFIVPVCINNKSNNKNSAYGKDSR